MLKEDDSACSDEDRDKRQEKDAEEYRFFFGNHNKFMRMIEQKRGE